MIIWQLQLCQTRGVFDSRVSFGAFVLDCCTRKLLHVLLIMNSFFLLFFAQSLQLIDYFLNTTYQGRFSCSYM